MKKVLFIICNIVICNNLNGDFLNENPIHPIPQEMTFEEYQDMNRRISMGLLLSAIPMPGTIHNYAGESKTAKKLRWIALGGIASIIIGASQSEDSDWSESPYEIFTLNEGQDNEIKYEMIPTGSEGDNIIYDYIPLRKETKGNGLVMLGVGILIADYIYDYTYGIKIIENKRDKARYKYGKKLDFSFTPTYDLKSKSIGIKLGFKL